MKNLTEKNLQILQLNILMIIILQNKEQELVGFIMGHFVHHETLLMKTKHT